MTNQINQPQSDMIFIGLGSNLGDRHELLHKAVQLLNESETIDVLDCSSIYETDPVGYVDQDPFLNMVVAVSSTCSPHHLFQQLVRIEQTLGRKRLIKWGPRTIDLDLLIYEQLVLHDSELTIPHPRMHEREFVLIPLEEVARKLGATELLEWVKLSLEKLDGKDGVKVWQKVNWHKELELFGN